MNIWREEKLWTRFQESDVSIVANSRLVTREACVKCYVAIGWNRLHVGNMQHSDSLDSRRSINKLTTAIYRQLPTVDERSKGCVCFKHRCRP